MTHMFFFAFRCGLVALMMALELLGVKTRELSDVLGEAKKLGITYNGEMFSGNVNEMVTYNIYN